MSMSKARTRGHWEFSVHPGDFKASRIDNVLALEDIVRKSSVELRGWDFPHVESRLLQIGKDWIQEEVDWQHHVEGWRMHQSGLFAFVGGYGFEWNDQSTGLLRVGPAPDIPVVSVQETIFRFTELYMFASRLATTAAGGSTTVVEAWIRGIQGRTLWLNPSMGGHFMYPRTCELAEWSFRDAVPTQSLVASPKDLARTQAREFFRRFGWDASDATLGSHQNQLRG